MKHFLLFFFCVCFAGSSLFGEENNPIESAENEIPKAEIKEVSPTKKIKKLKKASKKPAHPSEQPNQKEIELAPPAPPVY